LFEQALLGERVVGVGDQHLGLVHARVLEVAGDLRGALVGAGRAAERAGRHGDDEGLAVLHAFQLLLQHQGLRAGFPGMRMRGVGHSSLWPSMAAKLKSMPGESTKRVVVEGLAAFQLDGFLGGVDAGGVVEHHVDAALLQAVVADLQSSILPWPEMTSFDSGQEV
jgi:hypothetical protein